MRNDMECPYCGAEQEVCHDDGQGYAEGERHEHTCSKCEKTFVFETHISFDYTPSKADCLNGGEHSLKMSRTFPRRYSKMRCQDCSYERNPTDEEFAAHGIELTEEQQ